MPDPDPDWDDLDLREAASLFGGADDDLPLVLEPDEAPALDERLAAPLPPPAAAPPPANVGTVPPTPRMRQETRRRERETQRATGRTLGDIAEMRADRAIAAATTTNRFVSDRIAADYSNSLLQERRDAMGERFRQAGVTLADIRLEMLDVARTAAAEGEYAAAGQIYKTIAQTLGGLEADRHLHVHSSLPANPRDPRADFRSASDDALRALIQEARASGAVIDSSPMPTATDSTAIIVSSSSDAAAH